MRPIVTNFEDKQVVTFTPPTPELCRITDRCSHTFAYDRPLKFVTRCIPPHFHPIRSKTKINRYSITDVFPRVMAVKCIYFEFDWFAVLCVVCDWLIWSEYFGFGFTTFNLKPPLCQRFTQRHKPIRMC